MTARELRGFAHRWANIDKDTLVQAGIIHDGVGGSDWDRFNSDPIVFILKLNGDALNALSRVLNET